MVLLERETKGKKFCLSQNSIIEEDVEAIVNPANEQLLHGGGVAGLISRQGGPQIQQESNKKAPVKTGQATFTRAGSLPFKYIIHTVGPVWRGGHQGEAEFLQSAVMSALDQAAQLDLTSLSMPSISTGIFGYPLEPAIEVIVKSILDFLKKDTSLIKVHLCEFSESKALEIKSLIENSF